LRREWYGSQLASMRSQRRAADDHHRRCTPEERGISITNVYIRPGV